MSGDDIRRWGLRDSWAGPRTGWGLAAKIARPFTHSIALYRPPVLSDPVTELALSRIPAAIRSTSRARHASPWPLPHRAHSRYPAICCPLSKHYRTSSRSSYDDAFMNHPLVPPASSQSRSGGGGSSGLSPVLLTPVPAAAPLLLTGGACRTGAACVSARGGELGSSSLAPSPTAGSPAPAPPIPPDTREYRHTGHVPFVSSHIVRQCLWNKCVHGILTPVSPVSKSLMPVTVGK